MLICFQIRKIRFATESLLEDKFLFFLSALEGLIIFMSFLSLFYLMNETIKIDNDINSANGYFPLDDTSFCLFLYSVANKDSRSERLERRPLVLT